MDVFVLIVEILLLVAGVFLIGAVLLQHGKSHGLSGAIAGGAETFFGKEKGKHWDKKLSRLTTAVGIGFVVVVLLLWILVPDIKQSDAFSGNNWSLSPYHALNTTEYIDTSTNS